jgi:hypothetical protein
VDFVIEDFYVEEVCRRVPGETDATEVNVCIVAGIPRARHLD